jgi:chemotaxis protein methyltransferase CheR
MREQEFHWFRGFLEKKSGIIITPDKKYLIQSRLQPLLRSHAISDLNKLVDQVKRSESSPIATAAIDAMTTNETLFFRDQYPFEALSELIFPEMLKKGNSTIKVWSGAASRGQEAYSIAMTASEAMPQKHRMVKILGTDLSSEAIAYAKKGLYSDVEVKRGMPEKRLQRFFTYDDRNKVWQVSPAIKAMVQFDQGNLTDNGLVTQVRRHGPFDVVFLRNVLIYFTMEERKRVVDRIAKTMNKGGYLITGAAEIPSGFESKWEHVFFKGKRLWKLA